MNWKTKGGIMNCENCKNYEPRIECVSKEKVLEVYDEACSIPLYDHELPRKIYIREKLENL